MNKHELLRTQYIDVNFGEYRADNQCIIWGILTRKSS